MTIQTKFSVGKEIQKWKVVAANQPHRAAEATAKIEELKLLLPTLPDNPPPPSAP